MKDNPFFRELVKVLNCSISSISLHQFFSIIKRYLPTVLIFVTTLLVIIVVTFFSPQISIPYISYFLALIAGVVSYLQNKKPHIRWLPSTVLIIGFLIPTYNFITSKPFDDKNIRIEDIDPALIGSLENINNEIKQVSQDSRDIIEKANQYFLNGEYAKSESLYAQSLQSVKTMGALLNRGFALLLIGKPDFREKAIKLFEEGEGIAKAKENEKYEQAFVGAKGSYYKTDSNWEEAASNYRKALAISERIKFRPGIATWRRKIAEIYVLLDRYSEALDLYNKSLDSCREINDYIGEGMCLIGLGDIYFRQAQFNQAKMNYEKALEVYKKTTDWSGLANSYFGIGDVLFMLSDFDGALRNFEQADGIYQDFEDQWGIANFVQRKADIALAQDDGYSVEEYRRALEMYKSLEDSLGIASCIRGIADYNHFIKEEFDSALTNYRKALDIYQVLRDRQGEGESLKSIGDVYAAKGDYIQAYKKYEEALHIFKRFNMHWEKAKCREGQGRAFMEEKRWKEAQGDLKEAYDQYKLSGLKVDTERVNVALKKVRAQLNLNDLN